MGSINGAPNDERRLAGPDGPASPDARALPDTRPLPDARAIPDARALREAASSAAHGLNSLLANVAALSSQIIDQAAAGRREIPVEELRLIQQAALDGLALSRRLLLLGRGQPLPEAHDVELVDMARVVMDAVELTRPYWHDHALARGRAVEPRVDVEQPLLVRGSPGDLREIVLNLIQNAVDAMPAGGRLWLRGARHGQAVVVTCRDTGLGMDAATLGRVFEPFFTSKGERGTGLGLPIVRSVVRRHGGEASVTSEVGVGTTVTLRLPAAVPRSPRTTGPHRPNGHATARAATADDLAASLARRSVLVVEDDPIFRATFTRRFALDARRVEAVEDAASALALLETGPWEVLCVDDGLPDLTGRELAAEVRRRGLACAVILVTGTATAPNDPSLFAPGVDAVLPKPCTDAELARALRAACVRQAERSSAPA
jgi:CheY-like chemotaxis protein